MMDRVRWRREKHEEHEKPGVTGRINVRWGCRGRGGQYGIEGGASSRDYDEEKISEEEAGRKAKRDGSAARTRSNEFNEESVSSRGEEAVVIVEVTKRVCSYFYELGSCRRSRRRGSCEGAARGGKMRDDLDICGASPAVRRRKRKVVLEEGRRSSCARVYIYIYLFLFSPFILYPARWG